MGKVTVVGKLSGKEQTFSDDEFRTMSEKGLTENYTVISRSAGKPSDVPSVPTYNDLIKKGEDALSDSRNEEALAHFEAADNLRSTQTNRDRIETLRASIENPQTDTDNNPTDNGSDSDSEGDK